MAGILFIHGLGSSQMGYRFRAAETSRALHSVCMTFDLAGHGRSEKGYGQTSVKHHLSDAVGAYDRLISHPQVDANRIGVCGSSYGGYLAARLTAERSISRLFLRAPGLYDDEVVNNLAEGLKSNANAHAPNLFFYLNRSEAEILILESGQDEVIPHDVIMSYLTKCPRAHHRLLEEATHSLSRPEWDRQFIEAIVEWFTGI